MCKLTIVKVFFILYSLTLVNGVTKRWIGNGGEPRWDIAENWEPLGEPMLEDDVFIKKGLFSITIDSEVRISNLTLGVACGVCSSSNSDSCGQTLTLKSGGSLIVEKGFLIDTFGELRLLTKTSVTAPLIICRGAIRGSGEIVANLMLTGGGILDPYDYSGSSNVTTLTIDGNLVLANSTIVIDVIRTESNLAQFSDVIIVSKTMDRHSKGDVTNYLFFTIQTTFAATDSPIVPFIVNNSVPSFEIISLRLIGFGPRLTKFNCTADSKQQYEVDHPAIDPACQTGDGGRIEIILQPKNGGCCPNGWGGTPCTPLCEFCAHGVCEYDYQVKYPPTCACYEGWDGSDCSTPVCPLGSNGAECSLRGTCDASTSTPRCVCDNGWSGTACSRGSCPNNCSAHGTCRTDVKNIFCDCDPGYTGEDCSEETLTCQNDCSGHGTCNNITCECLPEWDANDCSLALCNGSPSCGLRGTCNSLNGTHYCECDAGWKGSDCTIGYCPNDCTGNGECLTTKEVPVCSCNDGKTGEDCSQDIQYRSSDDDNKSSTVSRDVIIGVVVGGVGVVILGMVGVVIYRKRQRNEEDKAMNVELTN